MLKTTEEYLREQPDLISFLAKVPSIEEAVRRNQELSIVQKALRNLPNKLLEKHYLGITFEESKPLKDYILKNLEGVEIHFLLTHLKLN